MEISKRLLVVAVIIGILTVAGLNYFTSGFKGTAIAKTSYQQVVVAKSTIPEHTRIRADMLEVQSLPQDTVHPEAVRSIDKAAGAVSRSEIYKGEQVLASRIVTEESRASLSYRIPDNMRAISVPVNEVSGVAGYISPGDKVDVLVTYADKAINGGTTTTYTVFQKLLVLAA